MDPLKMIPQKPVHSKINLFSFMLPKSITSGRKSWFGKILFRIEEIEKEKKMNTFKDVILLGGKN